MTTLASGSSVTFGLAVDQTFEMSFADGTTGTITVTGPLGSPYRTTFGPAKKNNWKPFPLGMTGRVALTSTVGSVSYTLGASSFVTSGTDAVTGVNESLTVGGATYGLPSRNGREFTTVNLPLNQSGAASVLPTDYSGNGVASTFGASNTTPWNWPGYFTASPDAQGASLKPAAAAFNLNFATDSFVLGFTLVKPITGSADTIAGSGDGTAKPGINIVVGTTGLLGPRIVSSAGTSFAAKFGTTVVGGGAVGATSDTAGYALTATTVNLASAGKGAFTAGDLIRFGTDPHLYTVGTGDADVSGGGSVIIPAPGLFQAIPAAATPITIVSGSTVHRCLWAWDAVLQTIYQYVDGVLDFSMVSDKTLTASELQTLGFWLGQPNTGASSLSQFAGFQFLKFENSGLPININEMAVQDNLKRRTGLMDTPVFL